jgi:hypothetical protein
MRMRAGNGACGRTDRSCCTVCAAQREQQVLDAVIVQIRDDERLAVVSDDRVALKADAVVVQELQPHD